MPSIYTDPGWALLSTSILSTSNCGNPALRLFGFGPVAADGYGIGYIIKEDGISVYVFLLSSPYSNRSSHSQKPVAHPPNIFKPVVFWIHYKVIF
jgi:hypothetical protein